MRRTVPCGAAIATAVTFDRILTPAEHRELIDILEERKEEAEDEAKDGAEAEEEVPVIKGMPCGK